MGKGWGPRHKLALTKLLVINPSHPRLRTYLGSQLGSIRLEALNERFHFLQLQIADLRLSNQSLHLRSDVVQIGKEAGLGTLVLGVCGGTKR